MLAGELQSVDGYMNIALEQTKEIVNGRVRRNYGDAFIRGNNGPSHSLILQECRSGLTDLSMIVMYISAD